MAALVGACGLSRPAPEPASCPRPVELRARDGRTLAAGCAGPAEAVREVRGPARLLFGLLIDPNRADASTLECLPGIGPVRAQAIVRARETRPFERLEDLDRVRGIGPKTLAKIAGALGLDGARRRSSPPAAHKEAFLD